MGHVLLSRKGVGSEMKEDGVRSRTGLHTSIRRRSPAPTGFFSVSSPPPGPLWLYLPAARPTFYSNLLVLTCSLLYPLLSHDPPPSASLPAAYRPHSRAPGVGPQCSIHHATKRTAQASADLPGSHFRLDGNPRDTHTLDIVFVPLSIPLIAEDLNSQTVRGVRGQFQILLWTFKIATHLRLLGSCFQIFVETLGLPPLRTRSALALINRLLKGPTEMRHDRCTKDNGPGPRDDTATMIVVLSERIVRGASSVCRAL